MKKIGKIFAFLPACFILILIDIDKQERTVGTYSSCRCQSTYAVCIFILKDSNVIISHA